MDSPDVPNENKKWCIKCKGHHESHLVHEDDVINQKCKECNGDMRSVRAMSSFWHIFWMSFIGISFALPLYFSFTNPHPPVWLVSIGSLMFGFFYYTDRSDIRNQWLEWANECGREKNAKNEGN
jgi:hypothetical protein